MGRLIAGRRRGPISHADAARAYRDAQRLSWTDEQEVVDFRI
jgi:hypothetical protein